MYPRGSLSLQCFIPTVYHTLAHGTFFFLWTTVAQIWIAYFLVSHFSVSCLAHRAQRRMSATFRDSGYAGALPPRPSEPKPFIRHLDSPSSFGTRDALLTPRRLYYESPHRRSFNPSSGTRPSSATDFALQPGSWRQPPFASPRGSTGPEEAALTRRSADAAGDVGLKVRTQQSGVQLVVGFVGDGPAEASQLILLHDRIQRIDNTDVSHLPATEVHSLLLGKPGSSVSISLLRQTSLSAVRASPAANKMHGEEILLSLTRTILNVTSVCCTSAAQRFSPRNQATLEAGATEKLAKGNVKISQAPTVTASCHSAAPTRTLVQAPMPLSATPTAAALATSICAAKNGNKVHSPDNLPDNMPSVGDTSLPHACSSGKSWVPCHSHPSSFSHALSLFSLHVCICALRHACVHVHTAFANKSKINQSHCLINIDVWNIHIDSLIRVFMPRWTQWCYTWHARSTCHFAPAPWRQHQQWIASTHPHLCCESHSVSTSN